MRAFSIFLAGGMAVALSIPAHAQKKEVPPDIFLVTIDTLRADHIHCYGYEQIQTPALDNLAHDGVRFAQAFTPSPLTNTSHTSILTGLLPASHGVMDFAVPLSSAHPTMAELLHQRGYHTAAFIGAVILDSKALAPGLDRGFDFYDNFPQHSQSKSRWGRLERRGMDVVQRAEAWLNAHPNGPHFVWVHLYDPHDPYEPPAPYSQTYRDRLYDGEIAYADSALANFVAYLKTNRWYQNSLIVVVGDHGEGLGEHHEDTHGIFLYDSTTHVPLIVKIAAENDGSKNKVINEQVRTIDILPTVLDFAQVEYPTKLDGATLAPYFAGTKEEQSTERVAFGETDYPLRFGWAPLRSVRAEGIKFIEAPKPELYDLHKDAAELTNQYEPWSARVQKFRAMLAENRAKASKPESSNGAVGQGTIDELKALGYLGRADVGSATDVPEPSMLPDPKDRIEEQNLLHHAMMASEYGHENAARESLERVLQLDPRSSTALRQLGEMELRDGEYPQSAAHLKKALETNSADATIAFHAGQALEKSHDLAGAREALESSLKMAPGQLEARLLLGEVYLALKNSNDAKDQFEAALLLKPDSVEGQLGVAKAQMVGNNFKEAAQQLEALSKTQSRNAEVFELLAKAYAGLGKNAEADKAQARAKVLHSLKK